MDVTSERLAPPQQAFERVRSGSTIAHARSGRALALVAGALALGLAALFLIFKAGFEGQGSSTELRRPAEEPRARSQPARELAPPSETAPAVVRLSPSEAGSTAAARQDPADFEGSGSIRGRVSVEEDVSFPETWKVVVRPSLYLRGKERAVEREAEYGGDEREFALSDLPLGGYDLTIEAPGMNSRPLPVLLVRGARDPFVTVRIYPTGFLDGLVLGEDGSLAPNLLVTLERIATRKRTTTRTGPTGAYLFEDVPDGEYRIYFGPPEAPLLPFDELSFRAPSMNFPLREIPPTASLQIYSVDLSGKRVGGVKVQGFGSEGGRIRGTTDERGLLMVRYLPPGHFNLSARDGEGRRGKMVVDIELGPTQELNVAVR